MKNKRLKIKKAKCKEKNWYAIKKILEISILLFSLLGTLLTIFAIQIEPSFGHSSQEGGMIYHAVKVPHPSWIYWGISFIGIAFVLRFIEIIVSIKGEKR